MTTTDSRPWLKHYPSGVPANIDVEQYATLTQMLDEALKKFAKMPAFSCMGKTLSFEQVDKMSRHFGAYLHSRGLEPGDRIALMMPNLLQYPIALFGALRAGLIVVNTNPLYTPREMLHQFNDSGAKAIVIAENFAANLQKILPDTSIKTIILTSIGELLGFPKGNIVNFVVRKIKKMVPKFDIPNTVLFKDAVAQGRKFTIKPFKNSADDTVFFQYTGGTTGVAKGAMLTNRNMVANMLQMKAWMAPYLKEAQGETQEVALCALPLYHIFALTVNCFGILAIGGMNVLVTNARDIPSVLKAIKSFPTSVISGVNTLFNAMMNHPDFGTIDFSKLRVTVAGGMALQRPVAERWQQLTGCYLAEGYGMTECSPVATANPFDAKLGKLGMIGLPIPSTDVRIVDEHGVVQGPGGIGEIQIFGPQVMKGYYNRPDATAETIVNGWLCTGDIGMMHEDGFFQIVDRKKDMILVSGFNVYPNEIEEVVAGHPKVLEVAAVGIPDDKSGEVVKLFVVKKDNSLTEKELIEYCRSNMTGYKVPKQVEFRKELPKTNVGKILRRALREESSAK